MICLICREAHLDQGSTVVVFDRDEMRVIVNEVPALVCPMCGEAYVNASTAAQLLKLAERSVEMGINGATYNFSEHDRTNK